jgi:hypothetical protein
MALSMDEPSLCRVPDFVFPPLQTDCLYTDLNHSFSSLILGTRAEFTVCSYSKIRPFLEALDQLVESAINTNGLSRQVLMFSTIL